MALLRTGDLLRLLADDTRIRILHLLRAEPLTVAELQEVLDLSQSSVSTHLAKLRTAGVIHVVAEGAAHRYRLRDDCPPAAAAAVQAVEQLTKADSVRGADAQRLAELRSQRGHNWVDRVAGHLDREYAPGRSWESLAHGFRHFMRLGRVVDVGAGDGAMLELLRPQATSIICVEPSAAMARAGRERIKTLKLEGVRYVEAAGEALPLDAASADTLLLLHCLHYAAEPAKVLAEATRVLAPGGRLLALTLLAHDSAEAERYGHTHRGFTAKQLRSWCAGLTQHEIYCLPSEARAPRFTSLVCTAVKADEPR